MLRLVKIWHETDEILKTDPWLKDRIEDSIRNTSFYPEKEVIFPAIQEKQPRPAKMPDNVTVTGIDTLTSASKLREMYDDRIAILNFANANKPGGCVEIGAKTQEEDLCRASTLYPVLATKENIDRYYEPHRKMKQAYGTSDILYTPDVVVFRFKYPDYKLRVREEYVTVDVITCAAPKFRKPLNTVPEDIENSDLYKIHVERGKKIIESAIKNGIKILVLGAFGCGDFNNDPSIVATAYKELMLRYAHYFKVVEFAVLCTEKHRTNYERFHSIISGESHEE